MNGVTAGAVSGAMGALAFNAATYADIAVRQRAWRAGPGADTFEGPVDTIGASRGERLGYGTGAAVGALYGLLRPHACRLPQATAGLAVGAAAMVVATARAVAAGTTDPRRWHIENWAADVLSHAGFGLATATFFDALQSSGGRRSAAGGR